MAYTNETSSVKTIVPGATVSGFCDVVARQKIDEASELSAGEGISISAVDGKTVITNNISAGSNISLVYDMETNTYRIDAQGGDLTNYYQKTETSSKTELENKFNNIYNKTDTSSKQELSDAFDYISANAGHSYSGIAPIQVDNVNNQISITGESLSAGPGIDMFSSGGYVVISANGGGGEGAIYTGISPIDVNNTTHQISAKGVSFGVQSPLFFVQDDNEAVIIGCSAGGGTTYTGDAQGALDEVYANSGVWLTAHQDISNKLDTTSFSTVSGTFLTAHQDISNLMPKSESANFYPMTGNPSGFINELPDEEEIEFEEIDLSDYALTSALDNKQNLLTDITDVQVVQSLPASPVSSVLYLIPEV